MKASEAQKEIIEEYAMIFEEESGFSADTALQAATDMLDKGLTYEQAYGKYIVDAT